MVQNFRITQEMQKDFRDATSTGCYKPFLMKYLKIFDSVNVQLKYYTNPRCNNSICLHVAKNFKELLDVLGKYDIQQPNKFSGCYEIEKKLPDLVRDIKNCMSAKNWSNFYSNHSGMADCLINQSRRDNSVNFEIECDGTFYSDFKTMDDDLKSKFPMSQKNCSQLMSNRQSSSSNYNLRGDPRNSRNSGEGVNGEIITRTTRYKRCNEQDPYPILNYSSSKSNTIPSNSIGVSEKEPEKFQDTDDTSSISSNSKKSRSSFKFWKPSTKQSKRKSNDKEPDATFTFTPPRSNTVSTSATVKLPPKSDSRSRSSSTVYVTKSSATWYSMKGEQDPEVAKLESSQQGIQLIAKEIRNSNEPVERAHGSQPNPDDSFEDLDNTVGSFRRGTRPSQPIVKRHYNPNNATCQDPMNQPTISSLSSKNRSLNSRPVQIDQIAVNSKGAPCEDGDDNELKTQPGVQLIPQGIQNSNEPVERAHGSQPNPDDSFEDLDSSSSFVRGTRSMQSMVRHSLKRMETPKVNLEFSISEEAENALNAPDVLIDCEGDQMRENVREEFQKQSERLHGMLNFQTPLFSPESEDESFQRRIREQEEKHRRAMEEMMEARRKRQKELEDELREARKKSADRINALIECIKCKHRFEEQEQMWMKWIEKCREPIIKLSKDFYHLSNNVQRIYKQLADEAMMSDFECEKSFVWDQLMMTYNLLEDDYKKLQTVREKCPEVAFIRILQNCIANAAILLLDVKVLMEKQHMKLSEFAKIKLKFSCLSPQMIYSTSELRELSAREAVIENIEFPKCQSQTVIEEL